MFVSNWLTWEGVITYDHITTCKVTFMLFSCWFTAHHIFNNHTGSRITMPLSRTVVVAWKKLIKLFTCLSQFHTGCKKNNQGWNMHILSYDKISTRIASTGRSRAGAELVLTKPSKNAFFPPQVIRTAAGCVFQSVWNFTVVTRHSIALCIFEHFVLLLCVQRCLLVWWD